MDFGSLDTIIQEEDLADAEKKKILASKKWQEHLKEHPNAQLIRSENEEILASQLPPDVLASQSKSKEQPDWSKEEEKKPQQEVQQQFSQDQHMAQHAQGTAWECNCGKAMEAPKKKDDGTAYKLQKDDDEDDSFSAYKGITEGQDMYGSPPTDQGGPGGAYLGGGNMEDHQDQLYNRGGG